MKGYFWNTDKHRGEQWTCTPCLIDDCVDCPAADQCIECDHSKDLIPSYLQTRCQPEIEFCETPHENYFNDGENFVCPDCEDGKWACGNTCEPCGIDGCLSSIDNTTCVDCAAPLILNEDASLCIDKLFQCADEPEAYTIGDNGLFKCENCTDGFTWEFIDDPAKPTEYWMCQECASVYPGCIDCRNEKCYECEDGLVPNQAGNACVKPIENCSD